MREQMSGRPFYPPFSSSWLCSIAIRGGSRDWGAYRVHLYAYSYVHVCMYKCVYFDQFQLFLYEKFS